MLLLIHPLNPSIRYQPHQRHQHIDTVRGPGAPKGEGYAGQVQERGEFAFQVLANGFGEEGVFAVLLEVGLFQYPIPNLWPPTFACSALRYK